MFLLQIITHTPKWVFALLIGLIILGLLQVRTRQVRIPVAFILPAVMFLLSISGVIGYIGWKLPALLGWLLGLGLVTLVCIRFLNRNNVSFDSTTNKFIVKGSWIPLLVILGIFITRYWLGVATAMNFDILQRPYFYETLSFTLGAWSGFFIARGVVYFRVYVSAN